MNALDIVEIIKNEKSEILGDINEKRAAAIIRQAFGGVARQLEAQEDGVVTVSGFGNFRIRIVEIEKDGKKETVKRIIFHPAKPKVE